ncbi:hypothetical protein J2X68_005804 [Streptomyces sp. 3330]|uniref:hypothetical protein n=1 Tax=Streptomyces sp. 3330 TaxID=2817755 RepID=UPI002855405A|nr:hypothetical protein [Streptomyces sp. 3330]MDR6979070.1 hypothetical protein [Streptomyces sp. 3330]
MTKIIISRVGILGRPHHAPASPPPPGRRTTDAVAVTLAVAAAENKRDTAACGRAPTVKGLPIAPL